MGEKQGKTRGKDIVYSDNFRFEKLPITSVHVIKMHDIVQRTKKIRFAMEVTRIRLKGIGACRSKRRNAVEMYGTVARREKERPCYSYSRIADHMADYIWPIIMIARTGRRGGKCGGTCA